MQFHIIDIQRNSPKKTGRLENSIQRPLASHAIALPTRLLTSSLYSDEEVNLY